MKASRRQELRTNDLAQYLEDMRDFFRSYGNYLAIGAVVIAAIVLVWFYQKRSTSEALTAAIKQMRTLPFSTDEEVRSSVKKLQQMATESKNEGLIVLTLRSRAEMAMSRAHAAEDGTPSTEFLDLAEAACKEVLDRFPDRSLDVGPALSILATIEEDRFVLDSDPAHKEAARGYLERVRDDDQFTGTPLLGVALERLNDLEETFVPVVIAEPLPPVLPPAIAAPPPPTVSSPAGDTQFRQIPASEVPPQVREQAAGLQRSGSKTDGTAQDSGRPAAGVADVPAEEEDDASTSGMSEEPPADSDVGPG
ncbi:MAG: hypothetical protein ACYSUI_07445 [Planctomycetota bacterium]|jgi:hypothetical protein